MEATTAAEKEARRRLAVRRVGKGWSQQAAAEFLGVHPVTVGRWVRAHRAAGDDALAATPHPGRTPFLTGDQERLVLGWLTRKPSEFGFATDLSAAARVAELIRRKFGVAYHPNYLREWLTRRSHSPQKPAERAEEQNPEGVGRWVRRDWPRIQKKLPTNVPTSS